MTTMKWLVIATAVASLMACGGSPAALTPPANIAGSYNGTITASSTCSALPSTTRVLQIIAEVTQNGGTAQAQLLSHGGSAVTVSGTVSGQTVTFPSMSFGENMALGATFVGSGNASVGDNGSITGSLNGTYQTPSGPGCNAGSHQLQMVKLCPQQTTTGTAMVPCAGGI